MALNYPDILEHNNPNNPLMDVNQLKGVYAISLLVDRDTIPMAKRGLEQLVICKETGLAYTYLGITTDDIDWTNGDNWSSGVDQGMLDLKAMQFVGLCKRINFKPTDIQIDSVNNTISISTVNSIPISEDNPIRFFTGGTGTVVQHVITYPVSASFTNTSGIWYVYFNSSSDLVCTQTPWSEFDTITTIYRFYLNATLSNSEKITVRAYEGHLNVMSSETHAVLHSGFGTVHVNGFELIHNALEVNSLGIPISSPNANGRNAVISLTSGKNSDDGLEYIVNHSITPTLPFSQNLGEQSAVTLNATNSGLFKIRINDVNGLLNFLPATRFPFAFNPTTNIPQYITSAGVRTAVPDNNWFVYYAYALQDDKVGESIKLVSAEAVFNTFALAKTHDWLNLQLLYPTLRDNEIRPLYKLTFYANHVVPNTYNVGSKYCSLVDIVDIRSYRPSTITTSGNGRLILASNVIVTPPTGYSSQDQQSFDNELAANTLKGNTTVHTQLINADSFGVLDSVNNVFKRISVAAIKAYVKFGLKASEVLNDSLTLIGVTLKDVLDAADAVEVQTVQDGDILAMARDNNGVSENVFVKTENAKPYFAGAGNGTFIYVSTSDEFVAAIGMEYSIIEICVTKPITVNPFSNVYADYVYLTGCEITLPDTLVSCNKTSAGTVTNYFINNALLFDVTDPIASVIVVTSSQSIARTWNITVREFKTTRPLGVLVTASCELNLITGNALILDAQQLVGSYTATVDATLDLGQEVETYTVYNESTLIAALASSKREIVVNVIADISITTFPQITPYKITFIGKRITITEGVLALSHSIADSQVDLLFLNIVALNKQASSIYSRITKSDTIDWNITFRVLTYERVVAITSGGAYGSINITTSSQLYLDTIESTGTYTTIYDYEIDNTGFFYRSFSQQGYNQVRASITDSGHLTINCRLTFIKDEIGSVILLPQNSNVSLHLRRITAVFLNADNPQIGDTYITGSITMPRFGGESESLPTFNLTGSSKGDRRIYGDNDGDGSTSYEVGSEIAILMENGDLLLNYTGGALGSTQQNRAWYNIVITGHADTTSGNWTAI